MDAVETATQPESAEPVDPHTALLKTATERFKQAHEASREDFYACDEVQTFVSGEQWPSSIKTERESQQRPCLTLDHLNQYVRHVVNTGLMQSRDVRVLAMSGEADDKVGDILAGMVRQITQVNTAKVAYETGLRHACQVGFGYWRVKVQPIPGTALMEIAVRKIKDPRMVLMDPFCDYPDGRDATYCFVLSKLTHAEFSAQYPQYPHAETVQSWQQMDTAQTLPWIGEGALVVAEYYYLEDGVMKWAVLVPDHVLAEGTHHGNCVPIIRTVGEEYEVDGKQRYRGMINNSSMDAQRAYNYSSSAFIESVALAPLSPFVAEAGQIEQHMTEWKDAHRIPRAVLRYNSVSTAGQMVPPPQRSQPAGIPQGWQGMMTNLIGDQQMIMGLAQPSVLGTGSGAIQSGAGVNAQQEPGEVNTFHFHEHWHMAIEQTGRVILAMIPHVYTEAQAVKIVGDDGVMGTAMLNPQQAQTMQEQREEQLDAEGKMAYGKVLSTSYNPTIGRYDVAITTGPSSASKKLEMNKMLMTMVNAVPDMMKVAGDLVVGSMDMAGADVLAKRLKAMLPPGITDDASGQMVLLQQSEAEKQQLQQQLQDLQQIVMGEREKSAADLQQAAMKHASDVQQVQLEARADLFKQHLEDQSTLQLATIKAQNELEISIQANIVKVLTAQIAANSKLDVEAFKHFSAASQQPTHEARMQGYLEAMEDLMKAQPEEPSMANA